MIGKRFSDEGGRSPPWLVRLLGSVFVGIWATYDLVLKPVFGDGERTIEKKGGETSGKSEERRRRRKLVKRRKDGVGEKAGWVDDV